MSWHWPKVQMLQGEFAHDLSGIHECESKYRHESLDVRHVRTSLTQSRVSHCRHFAVMSLGKLIRKLLQYLWNSYGTLGLGNIRYCVSLNTLHVTICFD